MVSVGGFLFTWLLTSCEQTHALGMLYIYAYIDDSLVQLTMHDPANPWNTDGFSDLREIHGERWNVFV